MFWHERGSNSRRNWKIETFLYKENENLTQRTLKTRSSSDLMFSDSEKPFELVTDASHRSSEVFVFKKVEKGRHKLFHLEFIEKVSLCVIHRIDIPSLKRKQWDYFCIEKVFLFKLNISKISLCLLITKQIRYNYRINVYITSCLNDSIF